MNRFNRAIMVEFTSDANKEYLKAQLINYFNSPKVFAYIRGGFDGLMDSFVMRAEHELMLSDPVGSMSIWDHVAELNYLFLEDRKEFIRAELPSECDRPPRYMISDGIATTRNGLDHYQKSADDILASWRNTRQRGVEVRDDNQGDVGTGKCNPYYTEHLPMEGGKPLHTGVVFCDQSSLNTSQQYDQLLNTPYMRALNQPITPKAGADPTTYPELYGHAFGWATPESDARLLSRRVFRNGFGGRTENGINNYEIWLTRREYDRDVKESLNPYEKDYFLQRNDMGSLWRRVDEKNYRKMARHLQRNVSDFPMGDMRYS